MNHTVIVRFDDICPTMNMALFNKGLELMVSKNIKPLIGVIPDCQDPDLFIEKENPHFWDMIRSLQEQGYVIAMHGVNHIFDSPSKGIVTSRVGSEFAGHTLREQIEKIKKGKDILLSHGITTEVFFAPAHSYDNNTLKALSICGFKYMSDGKSFKPYMKHGIKCLPCRASGIPSMRLGKYHTAVVHTHEWQRIDKLKEYDLLKGCLNKPNVHVVEFSKYASIDCGNTFIQTIYEKLVVLYKNRCEIFVHKIRSAVNQLLGI